MGYSRICAIISAILFFVAAVFAFGIIRGEPSITGLALTAFGFWVLSGAVSGSTGPNK